MECTSVNRTEVLLEMRQHKLTHYIDSLHRWSDQWSLPFNESKCVHMNFYSSTPSIQSNYSLSGTSIAQVSMYSDLGLILQKNLKWNNHYNYISAKAYRQLGLIKRTFFLNKFCFH